MRAKQPRQPPRRRFLQHEQGFDIVQAMNTLFRRWFEGESWDPWPVIQLLTVVLRSDKRWRFLLSGATVLRIVS